VSLAATAYLLGDAAVRRVAGSLHPAWSGLWLGLLPRPALHDIDETMYRRRRNYQGAEHNRRGLFDWEQTAVADYFPPAGRIAVVAAGGGREVLALWRMGFRPEGYECNPALVAAADGLLPVEGCPHRVQPLPRDQAPGGAGFDAAILGWSAYSLVAGRESRTELLRGMRRLLTPDGPLLLSFFTRGKDDRRAERVARGAARVRRLLRGAEPELGDDLLPNFVHRFTRDEIEGELTSAGFRLLRWEPQGPGRYDSGWAVAKAA
jgi:hypothetical protein